MRIPALLQYMGERTGLEISEAVGRYDLLRLLGQGGVSRVYLARDRGLDRLVALKALVAVADASLVRGLLRESQLAGSLAHPNIVTVYDFFEEGGTPFIAMEYIERGSLRPYIGQLTLAQAGGVLEGLLAGLAHAAQCGIVHCDLKPENLLVTADGRVKLGDFGLATVVAASRVTGTAVGTPHYMAPEQALAQDVGPWTDLYSVGCIAFELFTGHVPFNETKGPAAIMQRQVHDPIPTVRTLRPEVDPRISDWIERLLVKEPGGRTQSAIDAWDQIEEILISLLGPRWRREARLGDSTGAWPLPPAPFGDDEAHSGAFMPITPQALPSLRAVTPPASLREPGGGPDERDAAYVTFGNPTPPPSDEVMLSSLDPPDAPQPSAPPEPPPPSFARGPMMLSLEPPDAPAPSSQLHAALRPSAPPEPLEAPRRRARRGRLFARRRRARATEAERTVQRTPHLDLSVAGPLRAGTVFDVLVYADRLPARTGEEAEDLVLTTPASVTEIRLDVWLVATHHFLVTDAPIKAITLDLKHATPDVARFRVAVVAEPDASEEPLISASFSCNGRPSGRVTRVVPVLAADGRAAATPRNGVGGPALEVDVAAVAPDLVMEISSPENDGRRFEVRVETPLLPLERRTETWFLPAEAPVLVHAAMQQFFAPHASRAARLSSLEGAGLELFDAAPALFKEVYWRLVDAGRKPRTMFVASDERSMPWEVIVPHRRTASGEREVHRPLGTELAIGRWHRQSGVSPRQRVNLGSSYVVAPNYVTSSPLEHAAVEAEFVCSRFAGSRIEPARFDHLDLTLATAGVDLLHFACHGESDEHGQQVLLLDEPDVLNSQQIRAMPGLTKACRERKPLVFLNACEVGRPSPGLVGASGFAKSFIEIDASGVIGALWSVDDHTAHKVAVEFYEQILAQPKTPFAEVLRRIRAQAYSQAGDDTYAAYCFYGDPAASCA